MACMRRQVKFHYYCRLLVLRLTGSDSTSLLRNGWGAESPTDSGISRSPLAVGTAIAGCLLDICSGWILDFSTWKSTPVKHCRMCLVDIQFNGNWYLIWWALEYKCATEDYKDSKAWLGPLHFPGYACIWMAQNFAVLWVHASMQLA